jgi:hypothetical protein
MAPDTKPATKPYDKDPVASLCSQIPTLSTGARAALRRLFLTRSDQATGIVVGLLVRSGMPESGWHKPADFARWELLAHAAAVLSGTAGPDPHQPGIDAALGRKLHDAGYSELRLMRLTSARGPALTDQIVRAARMLAASGQVPVDLWTLHHLTHPDESHADAARLDLARAYFSAQHAAARSATP